MPFRIDEGTLLGCLKGEILERKWRVYVQALFDEVDVSVIHNLVRNPRTPIPTIMGILPRIRTKDLKQLALNRNVSEATRRQALRLAQARSGEFSGARIQG